MKVEYREHVKGHRSHELRLGTASWDKGNGTEKSIKYAWFDRRGHVCRGGEFPIKVLLQAVRFAKRKGYLK